MVECFVANENVIGSNPISCSRFHRTSVNWNVTQMKFRLLCYAWHRLEWIVAHSAMITSVRSSVEEFWSSKPTVGGSNPSGPAIINNLYENSITRKQLDSDS